MIQPRPAESSIVVPLMQNSAGARPPPIRVCPSSSWQTVPVWPPDAVSPKQQVEEHWDELTPVAKARAIRMKAIMMWTLGKLSVNN